MARHRREHRTDHRQHVRHRRRPRRHPLRRRQQRPPPLRGIHRKVDPRRRPEPRRRQPQRAVHQQLRRRIRHLRRPALPGRPRHRTDDTRTPLHGLRLHLLGRLRHRQGRPHLHDQQQHLRQRRPRPHRQRRRRTGHRPHQPQPDLRAHRRLGTPLRHHRRRLHHRDRLADRAQPNPPPARGNPVLRRRQHRRKRTLNQSPSMILSTRAARTPVLLIALALGACSSTSEDARTSSPDLCPPDACAADAFCDPATGACLCGPETTACAEGSLCRDDRCVLDLEGTCGAGTRWEPGMTAFADRTDAWGLAEIGAEGVRLAAVDIDGDGWTDLIIRRGGSHIEDLGTDGMRRTWILRNTGDGRFVDVTEDSRFTRTRQTYVGDTLRRPVEVVAFADVNNNGLLDAYTGHHTADPERVLAETPELLLQQPDHTFDLGSSSLPFRSTTPPAAPSSAVFTDIDRDGHIDLFIAHDGAMVDGTLLLRNDQLLRGDGRGGFTDITDDAGLSTEDWDDLDALNEARAHSRAWSAAACDLSGNGTPDLLAAGYGRSPNHLWQGERDEDGNVRFLNRSIASGYAWDDDMSWHDNQFARCHCQQNPDDEGCADVPPPLIQCTTPNWRHHLDRQPFRSGGNSGTTVCADINNSGHLDLLTTEIRHWWAGDGSDVSELLLNTGEDPIRFERPGRDATGLDVPRIGTSWDEGHMTAAVFDFDNDGWPDLYIGASDYPGNFGLLFHQDSPERFRPVPVSDGIDHHRSHGIAVADFNRNGRLDVVVGHSRARCNADAPNDCYPTPQVRLFENVLDGEPNFIQLRLEGAPGTNRAAIGARVRVTAGDVTQTREVGGGHGHYGIQHDLVLHFGLGEACEADIEIRWPDASLTTERITVPAGHRYHVRQGELPVPEPR
ncbi:MAG: CRTAC1 family protein [Deltaproteobacteria bacterium]|nr:MAG: CRTAC1 family protein [Deltaproteobacteria bacterium]